MKLIGVEMQEVPISSQDLQTIPDLTRALPPCLVQRIHREMLNLCHFVMVV